jgi:hypothetical protein
MVGLSIALILPSDRQIYSNRCNASWDEEERNDGMVFCARGQCAGFITIYFIGDAGPATLSVLSVGIIIRLRLCNKGSSTPIVCLYQWPPLNSWNALVVY